MFVLLASTTILRQLQLDLRVLLAHHPGPMSEFQTTSHRPAPDQTTSQDAVLAVNVNVDANEKVVYESLDQTDIRTTQPHATVYEELSADSGLRLETEM